MLIACSSASNPPCCGGGSDIVGSCGGSSSRRYAVTAETSVGTCKRRARPKARFRTAASRQAALGCSHAPRPGSRCRRSGSSRAWPDASIATTRTRTDQLSVRRHPTQVRTGMARAAAYEECAARSPVRSVVISLPRGGVPRRSPPAWGACGTGPGPAGAGTGARMPCSPHPSPRRTGLRCTGPCRTRRRRSGRSGWVGRDGRV